MKRVAAKSRATSGIVRDRRYAKPLTHAQSISATPTLLCRSHLNTISLNPVSIPSVMDDETAETIFRMQLEDLTHALNTQKGKQKAGTLTESESSMTLQMEETRQALTCLQDARLAQSISRAVETDAQLLRSICAEEVQAGQDHALAHRLAGQSAPPHQANGSHNITALTDTALARFSGLNIGSSCGGLYL